MRLIQIEVGPMQNFNYLIGCETTLRAALVDPAWEEARVLEAGARAGLKVTDILLTHTHPDHVEGLERAREATGAAVHVHRLEAARARERLCGRCAREAMREHEDGDTIEVGRIAVTAMHTPGHTPGATCWLVPGGVVTGDTLFVGRCGRVDFPGSDPRAMFASLRRLAALDDDTVIYPGHNYADRPTSTVGHEKIHNVHLSADSLEEFLRLRLGTAR